MPQAEEILKSIQKAEARKGQGKLKIFIGMVAGVGKTFAMLKAAHALKESGENPVVGYVETHGRKETVALTEGLPIIPRIKIPYKDVYIEEFDIDACLAMKPKLVLIDELAHTNAPGSRHDKRWQDVLEILNNGIDVFTTLNVQHIESRAETIASVTGIRVHELVPDSVIDRADEMILIDLIPDEVIGRLHAGKIYAPEKVDSATQNFFKVSNLTALREVSLRLMAERVDHELKDLSNIGGTSVRTNLKIMVAIFGSPYSESLIRSTRRLAYGLNCQWFAGYVNTDRPMSAVEQQLLNKNIELVKKMGGDVVSTQNETVVDGLLFLAQQYGASQIIVGQSQRAKLLHSLLGISSLPHQLIDKAKGVDINVVSPAEKVSISRTFGVTKKKRDFEFDWRKILITTGYVANLTIVNAVLLPVVHYRSLGILYLIGITIGSLFIKNYSIFWASFLGGVCWNVFFIPPRFTITIKEGDDWMLLGLYLVAGMVIGTFTNRLKAKEETLRTEGNRATQLYSITKELSEAQDLDTLTTSVLTLIGRIFGCPVTLFIRPAGVTEYDPHPVDGKGSFPIPKKEEYALQWVIKNKVSAGRFTDTLPSSSGYYVPLLSENSVIGIMALDVSAFALLTHEQKMVIDAIARQVSTSVQRELLEGELRGKMVSEESDRIYKTLLNSVSHEMRTPLATMKGFTSALIESNERQDSEKVKQLAHEVLEGVERLDYVVQNLLDMSRLETGNLKLRLDYVDIKELIIDALKKVKKYYGEKEVRLNIGNDLPLFYLDYVLIEQVIENIIRNAFVYTSPGTPIDIDVTLMDKIFYIEITDYGPGISSAEPNVIFQKFFREKPHESGGLGLGLSICKAVIELHKGTIFVENIKGKGASFRIILPRELDRELLANE